MNAKDELTKKMVKWQQTLADMVYERLKLSRQIEKLDQDIGQLEGALLALKSVEADMKTEEAILKAQTPEEKKNV